MAAVNDYKDEEMISSMICQMQSASKSRSLRQRPQKFGFK